MTSISSLNLTSNPKMLKKVINKYLLLVLVLTLSIAEALRIFCYQPAPFDSHQAVFQVLTDAWARDGHELVILTTLPRKQPIKNIKEIDVREMSYSSWESGYEAAARHRKSFGIRSRSEFINFIGDYLQPMLDLQLNHPQLLALIKNKTQKFDLMVAEANVPAAVVLNAIFKAPILLISPMTVTAEIHQLLGAETNNHYYPEISSAPLRGVSLRQKLCTLYNSATLHVQKLTTCEQKSYAHAFLNKHLGQQAPSIKELEKDVQMLFMNTYRIWDNNRPTPIGSALYVGGLHLKSPNPLPEDIKTFVDNSEHGVVIMGLGSKLKSSTLPTRTLSIISQVFSQLPYNFIWKWDTDELPNKPYNVRIMKNIPLNDLLHHPNVRAFITHGGLLSTHEAIAAKVPLIGLPVWPDHVTNIWQYEKLGIGIGLDIDNLIEEDFKKAIVAVVEEEKYRENIGRLSSIVSDNREDALQAASRWVLRLVKTRGARYLRAPLADTTLGEFFMVDVLLVAAISVTIVSIAIVFVLKRLISMLKNRICF